LGNRLLGADAHGLGQSAFELRRLLANVRAYGVQSMEMRAGPDVIDDHEERRAREQLAREREDDLRWFRMAGPARATPPSGSILPPVAWSPPPPVTDTNREGVVLKRKLARPAATPEQKALPTVLASLKASSEHIPDPSTPAGALAVEAGRLVYQIPNQMWVGVQETVEVRLGAAIAKEIMQGFVGRGDVKLEHVPIVETMKVSLVCEPGTFDIEPRSEEVQLVKPDLVKGTAFHQSDFARWMWLVTPCQRGKHALFVKVSAAIRDSRGLPTTSSLPDKIISVEVRVHLVRAVAGVFGHVTPLVVSGVVTTLVGIFTKDYWWPYVRDTIWPAVMAFAGM